VGERRERESLFEVFGVAWSVDEGWCRQKEEGEEEEEEQQQQQQQQQAGG
jgi:hypothetical protein